jgi:hypothetical protein
MRSPARHPSPERLEHDPAIIDLAGVPADELVNAVIDRAEEPAPPVLLGIAILDSRIEAAARAKVVVKA